MAHIPDDLLDDPRVARAGVLGLALHFAALLWCSRTKRNTIPWARVSCLLDMSGVPHLPKNPAGEAGSLPEVAEDDFNPRAALPAEPILVARHLAKIGLWQVVRSPEVDDEGVTSDVESGFRILDARFVADESRVTLGGTPSH